MADALKADPQVVTAFERAMNRITKWRQIFAGWQLGTRPITDAPAQAVRDHRELGIMLRVEMSALVNLLAEKGVFTGDEYMKQCIEEAGHLETAYRRKFPGARATDDGMMIDPQVFAETTKNWLP